METVETLAFLVHSPSTNWRVREDAQALFEELAPQLTTDQLERAEEEGQSTTLAQLAAKMREQLQHPL